jgi:hypothetical protein
MASSLIPVFQKKHRWLRLAITNFDFPRLFTVNIYNALLIFY